MIDYAWIIPILPYVALPIILFFGKKTPEEGAYIAIGITAFDLILSIIALYQVALLGETRFFEYNWLPLTGSPLQITVLADALSIFMAFLVTLIGTLVLIFSLGYMHGEEGLARYYAEMSLFVGSMLTIVMAGDLLTLFIGWELVGLSSYLLIGFWYQRPLAASAAKKAFLTTKFGDIFFVAGIALAYKFVGSLKIIEVNEKLVSLLNAGVIDINLITIIGVFFFMGAIGKSAQGPLMAWLWDAMEGPTTVSAILHSSTMVKAGVFLIARMYPIIVSSNNTMLFVSYTGGFTAFIAATMALVEFDIKRILAYSTISQIGYMMLALGIGAYGAGLFHLFSHATFKALLFLAAGSVVHAMHEVVHDPYKSRDLRYMGGLGKKMKITAYTMLIGALSLSGIPPLSGFFSKDLVIETTMEAGDGLLFWLAVITALLTAFYILRLWLYAFYGDLRAKEMVEKEGGHYHEVEIHESPWVMTGPLIVLATLTIIVGFLGNGFIKFVGSYLEHNYHLEIEANGFIAGIHFEPMITSYLIEAGGISLMAMTLGFVILGLGLSWGAFGSKIIPTGWVDAPFIRYIKRFLEKKYLLDDIYNFLGFSFVYKGISRALDAFDRYIVDGIVNLVGYGGLGIANALDFFDRNGVDGIVNGIGVFLKGLGGKVRRLSIGIVQIYVALIALGLVFLLLVSGYAAILAGWFALP